MGVECTFTEQQTHSLREKNFYSPLLSGRLQRSTSFRIELTVAAVTFWQVLGPRCSVPTHFIHLLCTLAPPGGLTSTFQTSLLEPFTLHYLGLSVPNPQIFDCENYTQAGTSLHEELCLELFSLLATPNAMTVVFSPNTHIDSYSSSHHWSSSYSGLSFFPAAESSVELGLSAQSVSSTWRVFRTG